MHIKRLRETHLRTGRNGSLSRERNN